MMMTTPKRETGCARLQRVGRFASIFLLLFVLATLATAFHHHEDGSEHHDCPVCAAAHHHFSSGIAAFSLVNV
jgi:hypothetical protein